MEHLCFLPIVMSVIIRKNSLNKDQEAKTLFSSLRLKNH